MLRIKFIFLFFIISSLYVNGFAQSNDTSFNSNLGKFELKLKYIFGNESLAEENLLFNPNGIFQDKENNYYILDGGNYRIVKYDAAHQYILQMGNKGQGPADLARPTEIFGDNDYIYVIDGGNFKIIKLNKNLELISTVKIDPFPNNLFFKNNFYYSSGLNARIKADSDLSLICTALSRCLQFRLIFYVRDRVQRALYHLFFCLDAFFDNCIFSSISVNHR